MPGERFILGVDTSTPRGGIALATTGAVRARVDLDDLASPSRRVLPSVRFLLRTAGLSLDDLEGLAVAVGPGSFTGIRVGLAMVRGLALATGLPVAGISTLEALAEAAAGGAEPVAAWLDAGRGEVYAGLYRVDGAGERAPEALAEEIVAPPGEVAAGLPAGPLLFAGSGALRYRDVIAARAGAAAGDRVHPRPPFLSGAVARLGAAALAAGTARPPEPRYLRPPDALRARGA